MGHRRNVSTYKRKPFQSPPSPNATVNEITVDIRVFFPPNAGLVDVLPFFDEVVAGLRQELIDVVHAQEADR